MNLSRLMQRYAVIQLRLCVPRQNLGDLRRALERRHNATSKLRGTKSGYGNNEDRPAQAVANPRRRSARRRQGRPPGPVDAEHCARLCFANLPYEAIVIE